MPVLLSLSISFFYISFISTYIFLEIFRTSLNRYIFQKIFHHIFSFFKGFTLVPLAPQHTHTHTDTNTHKHTQKHTHIQRERERKRERERESPNPLSVTKKSFFPMLMLSKQMINVYVVFNCNWVSASTGF